MDDSAVGTTEATEEAGPVPGDSTADVAPAHPADVHAGDAHPGPPQYIRVALILAVVTAVEVALYYTDLTGLLLVSLLIGLAAIKFAMVAAYFMHLKFDSRLLRRLFITGIVLAIGVYTVALFTMDVLLR